MNVFAAASVTEDRCKQWDQVARGMDWPTAMDEQQLQLSQPSTKDPGLQLKYSVPCISIKQGLCVTKD